MVTLARRAQRIPFAPVVAVLFGVVAAVLMAAVPQWLFEQGVVASGLPGVIKAAAPPLGLMARILAIASAFAGVAFLFWALLAPVTRFFEGKKRARTPWRDAGYDADAEQAGNGAMPPRRPIFAPDELGAPLMSDEAMAATPFVAPPVAGPVYEPLPEFAATPVVEPVFEPAPELAAPVIEEALAPVVHAADTADNSIAALIRRLEDGLARRGANDSDPDGSGNGAMPAAVEQLTAKTKSKKSRVVDDGDETIRQALGTLRQMVGR